MAIKEKDSVSGVETTGHEWDGIKELNTPLPRWWVYVFYATVLWAVGYWVVYPAWPSLDGYTKGVFGYSSRGALAEDLNSAKAAKQVWNAKFEKASVEEVYKNAELRTYAIQAGKTVFNENCSACHQAGGNGAYGYPMLADDEWIWGGTLADIEQTIAYGVRNTNAKSRQSEMPKFGLDSVLKAEQIGQVSEYVVTLAKKAPDAKAPGAALYAENCAACHGEKGEGMAAMGGPALDNELWLYKGGKEAIAAQVNAPKHGSMPAWAERLDATTVKQLAVYVYALGGGKK